jgi:penicillin-binding protein 1A
VGTQESYDFLTQKLGISSLVDGYVSRTGKEYSDVGLSQLALGGVTRGISTYEMAAAYATFPRMGTYTPPTTYLAIYTDDGKTLLRDNTPEKQYIIKESTAYYMNTMLTNAVRAGTGTSARLSDMPAAGKTGTTNNNYDRWFAGYTPYYTAVVWTGYNKPEYMSVGSKNPAAVLWKQVMTQINESLALENTSFPSYAETVSRSICLDCGRLATDRCGLDVRGSRAASYTFVKGDEPKESCTCHVTVEICKDCPVLNGEGNPTGFYHLTTEYCPEESRAHIALVDYVRELADPGVVVGDTQYQLSHFEATAQPCTVHDWTSQLPPEPSEQPGDGGSWWPWPWPWEEEEPTETEDPFAWPSDYDPFSSMEPIPSSSQPPVETPPPVETGGAWDYPWEQG